MLYTRAGDNGTTKYFDSKSKNRASKSSSRTESLGALDEVNSFLGLVKIKSAKKRWSIEKKTFKEIISWIQNSLFIIQAEVAGADKKIEDKKIKEMETWINSVEKQLPPIKTFFIAGGDEISTLCDICRTLARKAERRVVDALEKKEVVVSGETLAFLNRLSSLLYAMARLSNHKSGIKETVPSY